MAPANMPCVLCGGDRAGRAYTIREMMFGTRQPFRYVECAVCGSLQREPLAVDAASLYPAAYYAFGKPAAGPHDVPVWNKLRRARARYCLTGTGAVGALAQLCRPVEGPLGCLLRALRGCADPFRLRVLDVGCGNGALLEECAACGFTALTGIDPLIAGDSTLQGGVRLYKQDIFGERGTYDIIVFNHSLEHIADPAAVLTKARALLSGIGRVMVRIPTVSSYAWEHYRENWVQIDAPRHAFVPSLRGIEAVAGRAGFSVRDITFDSTEFQFWGSEQYARDIALVDAGSCAAGGSKSIFTGRTMASFRKQARALNGRRKGDQICVTLFPEGRAG